VPVAGQPQCLEPEPVQPGDPRRPERGQDRAGLTGALPAAHRPDRDQRHRREVDPGALVELDAAQVVAGRPALHYRHERQVRGELAQLQVAGDGAGLVLGHRQTGLGEDERLAHPVLRRGPQQMPNLLGVAAHPHDVLPRSRAVLPVAVLGELAEPTRVQRPIRDGPRQPPVTA
jgi:hypothetical protein